MTGPFFEDLEPGRIFRSSGMTLTDGHAAWFLSLAGDRNPVHIDDTIARRAGLARAPLNTALLAHVAIGHSTVATQEVVANLFYTNVLFPRPVLPGATLRTTTRVLGRAEATARLDRPPRGKVLLDIETIDDDGRVVVSMNRTALVRKASRDDTGAAAPVDPSVTDPANMAVALAEWGPLAAVLGQGPPGWLAAVVGADELPDPVVGALELVRATGNLAKAHRDSQFGQDGRRLVYGGHTLSIAQAALSRRITSEHVVVGWEGCNHPAPVFEEDLLTTSVTGFTAIHDSDRFSLRRVEVETHTGEGDARREAQRWTPIVLAAALA
jgi:2-methylfumaryl-CoA hydratase